MAPHTTAGPGGDRHSLHYSSAKATKPSNAWGATFPEEFDSTEDSKKFMERCLLLAMSQLLYSRNLLPSSSFRKRNVTDIIRCQVPNSSDHIGRRLLDKLRGAGEALGLGYLNEFIVVVSTNDNDHDDAVEVFTWTVQYSNDSSSMFLSNDRGDALAKVEYKGKEHVKSQTRLLLLRIRALCRDGLAPLPRNAFPTFRLTYTNATPKGYQAPGFYRSPRLYDLHQDARSLVVGGVATGKHKFLLSVDSIYIEDEIAAFNAVSATNEELTSDISTIQSDVSFVEDLMNNNGVEIEEQRIEPMEQSPLTEEKLEAKKDLRKGPRSGKTAPKKTADKSPAARPRKNKKPAEPVEEPVDAVPAKKSPGFSGKMTETTPTNSPPRNH